MALPAPLHSLTLIVLVLAALAGCTAAEESARPSLLLVTFDTTRADRLHAYGGERGLTPHADRLAADGVVFERAVSPIGTTVPSHATIFTGLYPASHRVRTNSQSLPSALPVVAEALREAGYATGAFVALRVMLTHAGLDRGFDRLTDRPGRELGRALRRRDGRVLELALEWLGSLETGRPFFGWVHLYDPHTPLTPTRYSRERLAGRPDAGEPLGVEAFYEGAWVDDPGERERVRVLYDGEVHATDRRLGRLLAGLEETGLADSTVVVLTADHGQALGDHHGYRGHGTALWDSVLRVPLVVRAPGTASRRVAQRVGLVDLGPTLLDLAGLPPLPGMEGRSLVPALHGGELEERPYFAETQNDLVPQAGPPRFHTLHRLAVFSGPHKLVRTEERDLLFRLDVDPQEGRPDPPGTPGEVRARLAALATHYAQQRAARAPAAGAADLAEALRALGYVE